MSAVREDIGTDLARLARLWRAKVDERLLPVGLSQARWVVLWYLARADGQLPQRELVSRVGVEGPTMVRTLDGLERQGLIARHDDPHDRRSKLVRLTAAADAMVDEIARITQSFRQQVFQGFADAELELLHTFLERMAANMGGDLPSSRRTP